MRSRAGIHTLAWRLKPETATQRGSDGTARSSKAGMSRRLGDSEGQKGATAPTAGPALPGRPDPQDGQQYRPCGGHRKTVKARDLYMRTAQPCLSRGNDGAEPQSVWSTNSLCRVWRRGRDSNPRRGFWPLTRFRVEPVTTTSVPLRRKEAYQTSLVSQKRFCAGKKNHEVPDAHEMVFVSLVSIVG